MTEASQSIDDQFQKALDFHAAGQLAEAETLYREILKAEPRHFHALHLLGVAAGQRGQAQEAVDLITRAIEIDPSDAAAHSNRGNALRDLKRYDEALASYDRAIALDPAAADSIANRGLVLQQLSRYQEAVSSFERAAALQPDAAVIYDYLGIAQYQVGQDEAAIASYDRGLALEPRSVDLLSHRGIALHRLRRYAEALASFDAALAIQPDAVALLINRGPALLELGRLPEALASYDRAIALRPDLPEAHYNRGNVLDTMRRYAEALPSYDRTMALRPDYHWVFGSWLMDKLRVCDWNKLGSAYDTLAKGIAAGSKIAYPFPITATPLNLAQQKRCAEIYIQEVHPAKTLITFGSPKSAESRLRVGYFSADFRNHPVAYLTAGLFETHDRHKFTIIAFSFGPPAEDAMRARLEAAFDEFIDVRGKTDREIAQLAQAKGIDIAVDLMGMTSDSRTGIFAERAAPVQVSYLGYPGTMGAEYIDYLIADATVIPPEHRQHYREKIACLPHTFQINDARRSIAATAPDRAALGLPAQGFVFCNFNNSYKLTPDDFDIWMRLLQKVPGSVLWLAGTNPTAEANLRQEAKARGVAPERLVFKQFTALLEDHLAQIRHADLFLDSRYFNAHTTGSDALWAGVPLLTCPGETYASRVGASLLKAIGLPELIAPSLAAYEALALELANDAPRLAAIRQRLADHRLNQPLFDTASTTRHIEAAYTTMAQRQRAGLSPDHIAVPG